MRILLLSQFYSPIIGGEETHVRNLAIALARRGHRVSIATQWIPNTRNFEMDGPVRVHRLRGLLQRMGGLFKENERRHAPPFADPELTLRLEQVVRTEKPDLVHAHNWIHASYLPLKRLNGLPLVVTLHDYALVCAKKNHMQGTEICDGPQLGKCIACANGHFGPIKGTVTATTLAPFSWWTRKSVDKFITVSRAVARYNQLDEFAVPYEVIPNFVPDDIDVLTPAEQHPCLANLPKGRFILFVGDLIRLKGIQILFEAYRLLPASAPPLVLIGRRSSETPELPPKVIHLGTWPHDAVMHAWNRCTFGVLPSLGLETFGIVIIEAMSCAKPFIASNIGGIPDVIDDTKDGFLIPPGDPGALATAMHMLLTNPVMATQMGETGLARVEQLKAHHIVGKIEKVYSTVMGK